MPALEAVPQGIVADAHSVSGSRISSCFALASHSWFGVKMRPKGLGLLLSAMLMPPP